MKHATSAHAVRVRTPQQARAREKAGRVLAAARHCFSTLGYEKTTMPVIARRARVSIGTVYSYFKDRDDILLRILNEHVTRVLEPAEKLVRTLPRDATLRQALEGLARLATHTHHGGAGLDHVLYARAFLDPKLRSAGIQFRARGLAVCRIIVRRHGAALPAREREAAAQLLIGMLEFCSHLGVLYPTTVPQGRAFAVLIDMVAAYLEKA
ncbi:TetR/AcrR family transcriptional regulator [bacterium]|nr:TetR/AcrR family transcriptional regulator [bacterium]